MLGIDLNIFLNKVFSMCELIFILIQIGEVTYSSFVLIGHKFPSPSLLRSYIERAPLHYSIVIFIHFVC